MVLKNVRVLSQSKHGLKASLFVLSSCALFCFFLLSCVRVDREKAEGREALDSLKQQYAPDSRVAVYELTLVQRGSTIVVRGDVDNPKAKEETLTAVAKASGSTVLDSIRVLPDPQLGDRKFGIVDVSVGNVRSKPGHPSELCTQALMGVVVKLLKKDGEWYFVQLPDQYTGWLEEKAITVTTIDGVDAWKSAKKLIVTNYFVFVRTRPTAAALPVSDAVMGGLLRLLSREGGWIEVGLPDGRRGYIEAANVEDFDSWKQSRRLTTDNIEKTAKMFIGIPYLWGGTSTKGMDCSGFTKTVFRLNGMELNRDADQQAQMGEAIEPGREFGNLRKGDLLFFGRKATAEKSEKITHVGIYLDHREFINSTGGTGVKLNSFDPSAPDYSESLRNRFVRARRLIGSNQIPEVSRN